MCKFYKSKGLKFEMKGENYPQIVTIKTTEERLIQLGDIGLHKENTKNKSCCYQSENYNYDGLTDCLCGKTGFWIGQELNGNYFSPKRILVIQMK